MTVLPKVYRGIETFVLPSVTARMMALASSPKSHQKLVRMLAHFDSFRPAMVHRVESDAALIDLVVNEVRKNSADINFEVLSENPALDGRVVSADELLGEVVKSMFGTFAVLNPKKFAIYGGEVPNSRIVLRG